MDLSIRNHDLGVLNHVIHLAPCLVHHADLGRTTDYVEDHIYTTYISKKQFTVLLNLRQTSNKSVHASVVFLARTARSHMLMSMI